MKRFMLIVALTLFLTDADSTEASFDDDNVDAWATTTTSALEDDPESYVAAALPLVESRPCSVLLPIFRIDLCSDPEMWRATLKCSSEQSPFLPFERREHDGATNAWSEWELAGSFGCADPVQEPAAQLTKTVEREFASLPITPSVVDVQPAHGHTFVQIPTIVFTTGEPQIMTTTLLGTDLEVEVTPQSFTWDFGDGSEPLVTTDPGSPYPNDTLSHTYTRTGEPTITLTTTWTGRFRTAGTTNWQPITGTATTTSTAPPVVVQEAQARLVEDPLS